MGSREAAVAIEHVIVVMLENASFDRMPGGLKATLPTLEGIGAQAAIVRERAAHFLSAAAPTALA